MEYRGRRPQEFQTMERQFAEDNNFDLYSQSYYEAIEYGMTSILQIAKGILPVSTAEQRKQHVESLEKKVKKLIKALIIADNAEDIVTKVSSLVAAKNCDPKEGKRHHAGGSNGRISEAEAAENAIAPIMTVTEKITSESKRQLKAFEETIQDGTIVRHPRYVEFFNAIQRITEEDDEDINDESTNGGAMNVESDECDGSSVSAETKDGEDVEGVPVEAIPQLDPVTKKPLTDPVRNRICRHIYGRAAILQLILSSDYVRCPTMGCANPNPLRVADLTTDRNLVKEVARNRKKDRKATK